MEPAVETFLSTAAEVGVGIIGFTGVVVALLGPNRNAYLGFEFSTLFINAATLIVFSLLPFLLLAAQVEDLWWFSSLALICYWLPLISFRMRQVGKVATGLPQDLPTKIFALTAVIGLTGVGFQVYNLFRNEAWLYLVVVGAMVLVSIIAFGVLLMRVWAGAADA